MPEPTDQPRRWRAHWPAAVLSVLAAVVALWAHHALFPALSWNRDEPVYLWQVELFRSGHTVSSDGGFPELFRPWLTVPGTAGFFSQYTPGWPLVLWAASVLTGSAVAAPMLGASLAVLGTYALAIELHGDRRVAGLAGALMLTSPILAIQGGVYLSYLFTLGLGLLFGALLLRGLRHDHVRSLGGAGILLGAIFMTRPYDAVLWGAAFVSYALVGHRSRLAPTIRRLLLVGLAAAPLVLLTLAYNRHLTNGWLRFPVSAKDSVDTFGFGPRQLMPTFEIMDYDLGVAIRATLKNAFVLPWFLTGGYLALGVAGWGLWLRRREPSTLALVLVAAAFPVGYFVFWGTHLSSLASRISGPIYFVPLYAPICLSLASVLVHLWRHRRRASLVLAVALVVVTVPASISRFSVNRAISSEQAAWRSSVAGLDSPSLVFVADTSPYLLYLNPFSANSGSLDDPILYAADNGSRMLDLIAAQPDRRAYLQQGNVAAPDSGPREHPARLDVSLRLIEVKRGPSLSLQVTVQRAVGAPAQRLEVTTEGGSLTKDLPATAGPFTIGVRIGLPEQSDLPMGRRGTVSIELSGVTPLERVDVVYRMVPGAIEVLTPVALFRSVNLPDGRDWRRTVELTSLGVDVRSP